MRLLQNPIIKIVGISIVIYFALFANKNNPDSLGNRFSPDRIKKNIGDAQERSRFIVSNVKEVQNYTKVTGDKDNDKSIKKSFEVTDVEVGSGKGPVVCGSEINASIRLETAEGKKLETKNDVQFVVGKSDMKFTEKYIIGMKTGGTREIFIPQDSIKIYPELARFVDIIKSGVRYRVVVNDIIQNVDLTKEEISCN